MGEESRKHEYTPLNLHPFVGLDLGERWGREVGELSQRLTHVEQAVARLDVKTDALQARLEEIAHTQARHDERFDSLEKRFDARFIGLEKSFDERFTSLEKSFDERFTSLEKSFDARFIGLEKRFNDRFISLEKRLDDKFGHIDDKFAALEKSLGRNTKMLWGMFTAMLAAIIIQKFI